MNIQPTLDRVLIEPVNEEETIAGLQIVRDGKSAEAKIGLVVASGPQSNIKNGTKVMFSPAAGTLVRILRDGKWIDCRIMHCDTIQCIFIQ